MRVRLILLPPEPEFQNDHPTTHFLAPTGVPKISESASVVVTDARSTSYEKAFDLLHDGVQDHPGARIVGAVTSDRSALVWVRVQPRSVWEPAGYTVMVHSEDPGPADLYPSVIYGWARWWLERLAVPAEYPRNVLLPRPPLLLDALVGQDTVRLGISSAERPGQYEARDPQDPTEWS
ncbi:hypothetical protein AB0D94_08200 [Streptomyces sp. NPDC048255]|uniref:hypothetical protein n=1 Tax=Streptomyces sp. NPDC048255 TaxID=3154713 RepID=UPI00340587FD